jgi:hypothetical protein
MNYFKIKIKKIINFIKINVTYYIKINLSISLSLKCTFNVPLPRALDGTLNAIIPSELLLLDVDRDSSRNSINGSINTSVFKIVKVISIIQTTCVDSDSECDIYIAILYAFNV